ncbi:type II toxin-antitoxin system RelE/ParE family toxin [Rhodoplanes azumiensis]|uniref:Type II toxin-antitoxin system RelE/ParE family toxin n=1 Tax=Rhodoplanes azumiensis TaxID=1897628 RepID=A0ABW5AG43_9BRAD
MTIRYTRRAVADLSGIAEYIRSHDPPAALRVRDAILDSIRTLALFPRAGRRQSVAGVRKLVTRKFPYLIYYSVHGATGDIVVLTVRHPARRREHEDG